MSRKRISLECYDSKVLRTYSPIISRYCPDSKKQQRSDVQLSERLAFLGSHMCPIEDTSIQPLGISQHFRTEEYIRSPLLGSPLYRQTIVSRTIDVSFSSIWDIASNCFMVTESPPHPRKFCLSKFPSKPQSLQAQLNDTLKQISNQ